MDDRDFLPEFYSHHPEDVIVFGSSNGAEAVVVKGMLEANGIQVKTSSPYGGSHEQLGYVDLIVPADQASRARELLAEYDGEPPEIEETEWNPSKW